MAPLVWFRRDLRLHDNPAFAAATTHHRTVIALFVLDERLLATAAEPRRRLLFAHLAALDRRLTERGGRLRVEVGDPAVVVPAVANGSPVHVNRDHSPFARRRDAAVASAVEMVEHDGLLVHPPGSVLTAGGSMFRVFTPFHRVWAQLPLADAALPGPADVAADPGAGLPEGGPHPAEAGEQAGLARVDAALAAVGDYGRLRDRVDLDATTHLSQHLKFGTVSAAHVVRVAAAAPGSGALVRQLAWRDFHAHTLWFEPASIDTELRPELRRVAWVDDDESFEAWANGITGFPIVDAASRQLLAEGWLPNRARMIGASFLVKDLGIDWRRGERHYRRHLIDGDVAQNVGNWQWVAGTGRDAAPYFRVFNPVRQGEQHDPAGDYIRRWVPELAALTAPAIHEPVAHPGLLAAAGITLGVDYPLPIVDHAAARRAAIARYRAAAAP